MTALALSLLMASGLVLTMLSVLERRRPSLSHQVLAYLQPSLLPKRAPASATGLSSQLRQRGAGLLSTMLGDPAGLERRLKRAGGVTGAAQFRLDQLVWGMTGLAGGVMIAVALGSLKGAVRPSVVVVLAGLGLVVGVLAKERSLDLAVRRREDLMVAEFPAIAELLALSVAAGEGVAGAIARVVQCSSGPMAQELNAVLVKSHLDHGLIPALRDLGRTTEVVPIARFVDAIAIAMERGTPMADVMRAQAGDVRDLGRRELMEAAGRKEIAMMVPVVFLVLPITVIFALFPGFFGLSING